MKKRLPGYGGRPPIWCRCLKPDMRRIWGAGRQKVMRATLEIPAERAPVSDLDYRYVPHNNSYLAVSRADLGAGQGGMLRAGDSREDGRGARALGAVLPTQTHRRRRPACLRRRKGTPWGSRRSTRS